MPFSFKNRINEPVKSVSVDSYFERLPVKDQIVPPMRKANPVNRKIRPNKISIRASHLGTLFFISHITGCSQIILMNSASKKGVIIDFA